MGEDVGVTFANGFRGGADDGTPLRITSRFAFDDHDSIRPTVGGMFIDGSMRSTRALNQTQSTTDVAP